MTTRERPDDPPTVSIEIGAWLVSTRVWAATALLTIYLAGLVGVVGWYRYDVAPIDTAVRALTVPAGALAVFLSARAIACLLGQRRRDRAMRSGDKTLGSDVSLASVVTVASYTLIGLIATGVAVPILHTVEGSMFYLAAGIAVVATPPGYLLLAYQLHELIGADRYRRGLRVSPAVWAYLAVLPWLLLAWLLAAPWSSVPVSIPSTIAASTPGVVAETITVEAWGLFYLGLCTPTALAFAYTVRRQFEATIRRIFGR